MSHKTTKPNRISDPFARPLTATLLGIAVAMCVILWAMGRVWWCEKGDWLPWSFDVMTSHNSQHLFDPYALSHFEHGVGLWLLLTVLFRSRLTTFTKVLVIAFIEASWEILENTPLVIQRYREATVSLDYFGDSIANSTSDYVMCLAGVWLARKIDWRASVGVLIALELISLLWIRDSLLINIIMLTYPIGAIREWQSAG
ncbi:DUF2585 family protein [Aporhodopirellula aestuarii]|uniref:DUF2585 family protein n=1 Tax=Aporhodopirellula aestuarii TaxID=2950107 RepID=A0ABT0UCM8_9BACT|nr:DUF2585 family protein [Aporhodopirellula aestuarii]MCM2374541.1 DUF2585 family protein [Aporhodopirellula aestuarii]